jgi:hypothetical protein
MRGGLLPSGKLYGSADFSLVPGETGVSVRTLQVLGPQASKCLFASVET